MVNSTELTPLGDRFLRLVASELPSLCGTVLFSLSLVFLPFSPKGLL
jgi:hypothetical protein